MAIQIPNPGTGNGATGDNEFVLWTKVKDNFSDQTNAASKLVGMTAGQIPLVEQIKQLPSGAIIDSTLSKTAQENYQKGLVYSHGVGSSIGIPSIGGTAASILSFSPAMVGSIQSQTLASGRLIYFRDTLFMQAVEHVEGLYRYSSKTVKVYTDNNTTIVNGSLKPSSPVVKIHTDSLELNDDAERMGVTLNKRGVGDYLLQNTTGLRNDGGWRIELPQDVNGNPYFAVAYNELENNDIEVKTYKRIFDMNTFMFGPDLDSPVDIKEGRSIAIRFNDLPQDGIQPEEVDLDK